VHNIDSPNESELEIMIVSIRQMKCKLLKLGIVTASCCLLLFIACSSLFAALPAAPIVVSAQPDTNQIRIGEQFKIELRANVPTGVHVDFPVFPDTLNGIEIVSRGNIDTLIASDKSSTTFSQSLRATSFDSGFYAVEPFKFTNLNKETGQTDTFFTEAFLISVKTIPIDTTQAIKDIKAPLTVPITWQEILLYVLIAILIIGFVWLGVYLWKRRKKPDAPLLPKIPSRPAHELALEALRKTESEKLWQQGLFKLYHSNVSDILREYIERSYDINALELTSDETLERIHRIKMNESLAGKLAFILHTADLVKFAKLVPMPDENEKTMGYAYDFINGTRPVVQADFSRKEVES